MDSNQEPSRSTLFFVILSFAGAIAVGLAWLHDFLDHSGRLVMILAPLLLLTVLISPLIGGYALYRVLRARARTPLVVWLTVLGFFSNLAVVLYFFLAISAEFERR